MMAKQTKKYTKEAISANSSIPEIPIRVTIEVVIRHDSITQTISQHSNVVDKTGGAECPDNKFSYSFEKENASVLSLIVEGYQKDSPEDTGEFTTCINDPSPSQRVRVIGLAKEDNAGGRVALKLKFLGKDLYTKPREFTRSKNGFLELNELVKLPLK